MDECADSKYVMVRQARRFDLDRMVEIDKEAYGKNGASKEYFVKKMVFFPRGTFVVEDHGKVTGFTILELMEKDGVPEDFCDMRLSEPIKGSWVHIVAFTTETNYKDKKSDSKLLLAAEKIAKDLGCVDSCVPLNKDHPFKENGVFEFWELNGYSNIGEIKWMPNPKKSVECYFYRKHL